MTIGALERYFGSLPGSTKQALIAFVQYAFKNIRFGAPGESAVAAENFGGHIVPVTTSGTANGEVAVAHALARIPRMAFPVLALDTVNATMPILTVTRAADRMFFYVSSPTTNASLHLYVE